MSIKKYIIKMEDSIQKKIFYKSIFNNNEKEDFHEQILENKLSSRKKNYFNY